MVNLLDKRIIKLDQTGSTNLYAWELLKRERVEEGTVIWTHNQTAGKGQGDNEWISQPGKNLTFSMILYPCFLPAESQFMLNKSVSLAALDFVRALLPAGLCKIKWPNDIYLTKSKLGGILITNAISGTAFDSSIIGIGININQTRFDPELPNPISIKQFLKQETEIDHCLNGLISALDHRYDQMKKGVLSQLNKEYRDNLLGIDEDRCFKKETVLFNGFIRDVDHSGRLIIETADNRRLKFSHKEVEMLM